MEAKAVTRYIRISPRKVRPVINLIRSKPLFHAYATLAHLNKKGARVVEKTLKSVEANARVKKMDERRLYIGEIRADGGPVLKRFMARSMGRANVILKRTTHLSIVLKERETPVSAAPNVRTEATWKGFKVKKGTKAKAVGAGAAS